MKTKSGLLGRKWLGIFKENVYPKQIMLYTITFFVFSSCISLHMEWVSRRGHRLRLSSDESPKNQTYRPEERSVLLFYRKFPKEHICFCNAGTSTLTKNIENDKMLVISDVYEYFVTASVERLELEIPVHKTATSYDDVFLRDSLGRQVKVTLNEVSKCILTMKK